jgi:hypothetical protein
LVVRARYRRGVDTNRPAPAQADLVQAAWRRGQGPDTDAVVLGDGSLIVMEMYRSLAGTGDSAPVAFFQTLLTATAWTADEWLDLDTYNDAARHGRHWAIAGEASTYGSIGWVALVTAPGGSEPGPGWRTCAEGARVPDSDEHTLEWLLISRHGNPFCEVVVDDTQVRARNTLDECWTIPRDTPQHMKITRLAWDDPL